MNYPCEIVLKSYIPSKLKEGMYFVNRISVGVIDPYIALWQLEKNISIDIDEFMSLHGAPVNILVVDKNNNILATEENIGWWDVGEDSDELRDITLEDINLVLRDYDGQLFIEVEENNKIEVIITSYKDKVVLSIYESNYED